MIHVRVEVVKNIRSVVELNIMLLNVMKPKRKTESVILSVSI